MEIIISEIAAGHVRSFRECLDAVARERRFLAMVEAPPIEQVEVFVRESVAAGEIGFVALDQGTVVGWADIFPEQKHATAHRGSLGIGLLSEYRGRGLGRRLLNACISKAWVNGLTRIELETRCDNAAAIRLFERCGFEREGVRRCAMRLDGEHYDTLLMSLLREGDPKPEKR